MADDMSNNNDAHRTYTDAITAQLGERVTRGGSVCLNSLRRFAK